MITLDNLRDALRALCYEPSGDGTVYQKSWEETSAQVTVDFSKKRIGYPKDLGFKVNKDTTCNFSDNENFVVLACVTMLLDKGYRPESLELEREWALGHEQKSGRADICINDERGDTLAIVECKTPGTEFKNEFKNMQSDGGQLLSYWQQERATRWLVLFACDFINNEIVPDQVSINCSDDENFIALAKRDDAIALYRDAHTVEQLHQVWTETYNQQVEGNILFGDRSTAYHPMVPPLLKKDLVDFRAEDSIVNRFEEILRHNNVSDKENAFNRLIALFIAKLQDELSKMSTQEIEFQYRQGRDTYETLQDRLQRLHSDGMRKLMREEVLYVPNDYAENLISNYTGQHRKKLIEELNGTLRKLKFYTNNDFAFKDVHNEELFLQNGKVLVETVQLLQPYRIVGTQDIQFLGDLFEQLLNQGFKQNEGQFFTPVPITRFIWKSLPLDSIVQDEAGAVHYPRVIDYACGAGHFLTEGFEEISDAACQYDPTIEDDLGDADWVRDNLVGIEKDYRLARVSKVSFYMHGAGQGNVVFGDGLENYPDKGIDSRTDRGRFDILVANPPYSVAAFKPHLKLHNNELKVLETISDSGSEIETLFVERAAQLVRPGGYAAIVLPTSILDKSTSSSFMAARDVLLSSFEIVSIARFGSGTFAATGTNVAIMFLRRFDEIPPRNANALDFVDAVFERRKLAGWKDESAFNAYLGTINVDGDTYRAFLAGEADWNEWANTRHFNVYCHLFESSKELKTLRKRKTWKAADKNSQLKAENELFYRYAHKEERRRLRVWGLVCGEQTLIINSPNTTKEIASFLGYKWSNRKGNEGIQPIDGEGVLYSDDESDDTNSLSGIIRAWFSGEQVEPGDLAQYYYYAKTADFIDFDAEKFDETLTIPRSFYRPRSFAQGTVVKTLGDITSYVTNSVAQSSITTDTYVTTENMVKDRGGITAHSGELPASTGTAYKKGDTLVSNIRPYLQKIWLADRDGACSKDVLVFRSINTDSLLPEFLHLLLWQKDFFDYDMSTFTGTGRPRGDKDELLKYPIPVPTLSEQRALIDDFNRLTDEINSKRQKIAALKESVKSRFVEMFAPFDSCEKLPLCNCVDCVESGKSPKCLTTPRAGSEPAVLKLSAISTGTYCEDQNKALPLDSEPVISKFVRDGDILLARKNTPELVGRSVLVRHTDGGIMFPDIVFRMHPLPIVDGAYLSHLLSETMLNSIRSLAHGSAKSMSNIPKTELEKLLIPIPPASLQRQFADFVTQVDKSQFALEQEVDALSAERDALHDRFLA